MRILLIFLLLGCACTRHPHHQHVYDRVSLIIDSLPDRALAILDSIPKADLQTGLDSARYILLHATAENKLHNFTTNDSILEYPIEIFTSLKKNSELFQAYYLKGRYQEINENYQDALKNLLHAESLIDRNTTEYRKGLLYHELAECSNAVFSTLIAIEYINKAEESYRKAKLNVHLLYALNDRGLYLNNIGHFPESEKLFSQLLDSAGKYDREDLIWTSYDGLARSYIGQKRYREALKYLRLLEAAGEGMDEQTYGLLVLAENRAGNKHKADSLARRLLTANNPWIVQGLDPARVEVDTILKAFRLFEANTDSVLTESGSDVFPWALKENYNMRTELTKARIENQRLWTIIIIGGVILCFTVFGIVLYRHYNKLRKQKLFTDNLITDLRGIITSNDDTIQQLSNANQQVDTSLNSILKLHSDALNSMAKAYYGKPMGRRSVEVSLSQLVEDVIDKVAKNLETGMDLVQIANLRHNNAVERLRQEIPDIKKEEERLFVLCVLGLSNMVISRILKLSGSAYVASKKTFLRNKINESGAPSTEEFISLIG